MAIFHCLAPRYLRYNKMQFIIIDINKKTKQENYVIYLCCKFYFGVNSELQDTLEALCSCKQAEQVCGTDNKSYDNICQLREASMMGTFRGMPLAMKNWGPCESGMRNNSGGVTLGIKSIFSL